MLKSFHKIIGKSAALLLSGIIFLTAANPAYARIVFKNEFLIDDNGTDTFIIDSGDDVSGALKLQFGNSLAETISFDTTNSWFDFSDNININGVEDTERIRFTDTTNTDSVSLFTGLGDPDGALSAEAGSLFLDQAGDAYVNRSTDSGTDWGRLIATGSPSQYAQTVIVAKSGAEFTSIKAAIDSITDAGPYKGYIVLVYPGSYVESPITMKPYVNVFSVGGGLETQIISNNPTANLVTMASYSEISGFALIGITTGNCLYASNTPDTAADNISFINCQNGLRATGASTSVVTNKLIHISGTTENYIIAENGAEIHATNTSIIGGTITNGFNVTGSGSYLHSTSSIFDGATITNGVYVNDGATINATGLIVNNATYGTRIGSTGTDSKFIASGAVYQNSGTLDLFVEANDANIVFSGGIINRNKIDIPAGNKISILFSDETEGDEGTINLGEFSVGSPENPAESVFGEGDSYTDGMLVYTYNGSTYTDVSTEAASASGSTFTFPGTAVNNAIYISSDRKDSAGNLVQFLGYKMSTSGTALVEGTGNIVHEYWNGSSWTPLHIMCTNSSLYYRYDESCFLRANSSEQVRFNNEMKDDWAKNDPVSSGTNRYWVRARIDSAITTAPIFEQFKVHSNRTEINADGTMTFHGDARHRKTFIVSPATIFFGASSNSPDNVSYEVATSGWTETREKAAFNGGTLLEELTGAVALPRGIDTSNGVIARIYWKKINSNAGNVKWNMDYIVAGPEGIDVTDGSNIATAPRASGEDITTSSFTSINTAADGDGASLGQVIMSEFTDEIDISGNYEGDTLFLRLYRDPTDVADTYGSDAVMVGFELNGVFWTLGEKL